MAENKNQNEYYLEERKKFLEKWNPDNFEKIFRKYKRNLPMLEKVVKDMMYDSLNFLDEDRDVIETVHNLNEFVQTIFKNSPDDSRKGKFRRTINAIYTQYCYPVREKYFGD